MDNRNLQYNDHDADVDKVVIGPRTELNLVVRLDPVLNTGNVRVVNLSFRAVDNIDIVREFVEKHLTARVAPNAFLGRIGALTKISRSDYVIDFDDAGQLTVSCKGHFEIGEAGTR